jgi:quercetin dioxygenase-like cupin family protein
MSTDTGSSISFLPSGEGHAVQVLSDLVCTKVSPEQTDGAFVIFQTTTPPGGGPPLHRHAPAETFFILEGDFVFRGADGQEFRAGAGDTVHVPPREPHTYSNVGDGMGRLLAIFQPAGFENYFDELGTPADGSTEPAPMTEPPDVERLMKITARHGVEHLEVHGPDSAEAQ